MNMESTFASKHGQNMYIWIVVSSLSLFDCFALALHFRQIKVTIAMLLCYVSAVAVEFVAVFLLTAPALQLTLLLVCSIWGKISSANAVAMEFSGRPEKTVRRCGCVAWHGCALMLMLVKCFEPDAQMHLHLICVAFYALKLFFFFALSLFSFWNG